MVKGVKPKTAIVIGSGFGGLAIAIRLQARDIQTTIYEKQEMLGGHAYQLKKRDTLSTTDHH